MKNKTLYIGLGIAALAVLGFVFLRKKNTEETSEGSDESGKSASTVETASDSDLAEVEAEVAEAKAAEEELASLEKQPSTPETEAKKKKLREKLARFGSRTRENTRVGRILRDVGKKTNSNIKEMGKNIAKRRQCRKEADDKFGFPLKLKKIKEKRDYIEKCKKEGGEGFAFSYTEETYDLFA